MGLFDKLKKKKEPAKQEEPETIGWDAIEQEFLRDIRDRQIRSTTERSSSGFSAARIRWTGSAFMTEARTGTLLPSDRQRSTGRKQTTRKSAATGMN